MLTLLDTATANGLSADYVLFDCWFANPAQITAIKSRNMDVIAMLKKSSRFSLRIHEYSEAPQQTFAFPQISFVEYYSYHGITILSIFFFRGRLFLAVLHNAVSVSYTLRPKQPAHRQRPTMMSKISSSVPRIPRRARRPTLPMVFSTPFWMMPSPPTN